MSAYLLHGGKDGQMVSVHVYGGAFNWVIFSFPSSSPPPPLPSPPPFPHTSALVCADVTFIEPETRGQVLRGLDFYKFKFSNGQCCVLPVPVHLVCHSKE